MPPADESRCESKLRTSESKAFNPLGDMGTAMPTKKKRSKKATKKKAYYSGRKEKRAKKK